MYLIEGVLFLRKSSMMEFIEKEMEKAREEINRTIKLYLGLLSSSTLSKRIDFCIL
jgi:hypothetical protein